MASLAPVTINPEGTSTFTSIVGSTATATATSTPILQPYTQGSSTPWYLKPSGGPATAAILLGVGILILTIVLGVLCCLCCCCRNKWRGRRLQGDRMDESVEDFKNGELEGVPKDAPVSELMGGTTWIISHQMQPHHNVDHKSIEEPPQYTTKP